MAFITTPFPLGRAPARSQFIPSTTHITNRIGASCSFHRRSRPAVVCMAAPSTATGGPARSTLADTPRKEFLTRLKPLGKVRLIARNDAAIMESIATFDGLFFAAIPSGEYANIIDMSINLDMHLLLSGVSGARFEIGVSRSASRAPTYVIRILGKDRKSVVLSVFMQWDKEPTDIATERIDAWKQLKTDYAGEAADDTFFFDP